jgi:AraC-like DNA-binding protein
MPPDRASIDPAPSQPHQAKTCARRGVVRSHVVVAVRLLRERIAEPWTLDALADADADADADAVHLSRSQLARSFAATVGTSPMAYLRQMRVERMARLLVSTDLSVAEAARSVGWRNQFHASQCFHADWGLRPLSAEGGNEQHEATPDAGSARALSPSRDTVGLELSSLFEGRSLVSAGLDGGVDAFDNDHELVSKRVRVRDRGVDG